MHLMVQESLLILPVDQPYDLGRDENLDSLVICPLSVVLDSHIDFAAYNIPFVSSTCLKHEVKRTQGIASHLPVEAVFANSSRQKPRKLVVLFYSLRVNASGATAILLTKRHSITWDVKTGQGRFTQV